MNATYLWVNNDGTFNDRCYKFTEKHNTFPEWRINNEYILVPILAFKDPFNLDDNYCLIFCDLYYIDGEEKILDESNKRNDFLEYIKYDTNFEIIQGYELDRNNINIFDEFIEKCHFVGINIKANNDAYTIFCECRTYETVWITRYILNRMVILNNMTLYFTDLSLVRKSENINNLFNTLKLSNKPQDDIYTLLNELKI